MQAADPILHDVVIAGAGPVGLFLACELRLGGASVLVLEQAQDLRSALKRLPFGLRGLTAPTLDAFHRRGLLDGVLAIQRANDASGETRSVVHWARQERPPAGHFAGLQFYRDRVDASTWPWRLPGAVDGGVTVDMESLEALLAARAGAMGAEILRGVGLEGFDQSDDEVRARAGGRTFRGRWLVGCDGGRSATRKAGGFQFAGTDPEFTGYSVFVELEDPDMLRPGRCYTDVGVYTYAPPGVVSMVDFDGGAFHRAQPITLDHVQATLRRVSGVDVVVTRVRLASTWTDRAVQATAYRNGRALLAGDAAHLHSPLGGQGLNLGLGDAVNLGWKLAATIRGDASPGLLDSYGDERQPVGARVLEWSRAQVALMRPTPGTRALRNVVADLVETRDGATYFAERVWGVTLRYDLGDAHPLVGRSVPDFELIDGRTIGQLLRAGTGVLLDFDARPSLQALAGRWSGRVAYVASDVRERLGLSAVLARPDGFVAWAGESVPDEREAARAASRWFGEPARS